MNNNVSIESHNVSIESHNRSKGHLQLWVGSDVCVVIHAGHSQIRVGWLGHYT